MDKDNYFLIANHLRDIHFNLESKIFDSKSHSPKWDVGEEGGRKIVAELEPLLGIARLLEKLARPVESQQFSIVSPQGMDNEE